MAYPIRTFRKDPNAVGYFGLEWGPWLHGDPANPLDPWESGDPVIEASEWLVPAGITDEDDSDFTDTRAQVKLSGGTAGEVYDLVNRITTSEGETEDRTIRIIVSQE